jgi:hypothetical protein
LGQRVKAIRELIARLRAAVPPPPATSGKGAGTNSETAAVAEIHPGEIPKSPLAVAAEKVQGVLKSVDQLEAAGCQIADGLLACSVTIPPTESDGIPHRGLLDAIADLADTSLSFRRGALAFDLRLADSTLQFSVAPSGDPASEFSGKQLLQAQRAWGGDIDDASKLSGIWRGSTTVDLASPLKNTDSTRAWRAVRTVAVLVGEMALYPWWRARELFIDPGGPVIVAIASDEGVELLTSRFGVASLDRLIAGVHPTPAGIAQRLAVVTGTGAQVPTELPLPEELEPVGDPVAAQVLVEALRPWSDACAWAWMSNTTTAPDEAESARLEYFGYRRRHFELSKTGYVGKPGQRAYKLYTWATSEVSADRILAVRQVVSLYEGADLPSVPNDVMRAAEPLYLALRTDKVAAALETQRQARAIAVDAARQSADAAQGAAKSTAERTIASLAAVAGVAVANATAALSDRSAQVLAIGIAVLFVLLGAWTFFIEGPSMATPINSFKTDLDTMTPLVGEADRKKIEKMAVLSSAQVTVDQIRLWAPIVYGLGAIVSLGVAHYAFGLWPDPF